MDTIMYIVRKADNQKIIYVVQDHSSDGAVAQAKEMYYSGRRVKRATAKFIATPMCQLSPTCWSA